MVAAYKCVWWEFIGNHVYACVCHEVLKFSALILLIMQYKKKNYDTLHSHSLHRNAEYSVYKFL